MYMYTMCMPIYEYWTYSYREYMKIEITLFSLRTCNSLSLPKTALKIIEFMHYNSEGFFFSVGRVVFEM